MDTSSGDRGHAAIGDSERMAVSPLSNQQEQDYGNGFWNPLLSGNNQTCLF